jgi:hypothetical protein
MSVLLSPLPQLRLPSVCPHLLHKTTIHLHTRTNRRPKTIPPNEEEPERSRATPSTWIFYSVICSPAFDVGILCCPASPHHHYRSSFSTRGSRSSSFRLERKDSTSSLRTRQFCALTDERLRFFQHLYSRWRRVSLSLSLSPTTVLVTLRNCISTHSTPQKIFFEFTSLCSVSVL